jgi:hypothetical protein
MPSIKIALEISEAIIKESPAAAKLAEEVGSMVGGAAKQLRHVLEKKADSSGWHQARTIAAVEVKFMNWDVVEVKVEAPLSLHVRFLDGTSGKVRFHLSFLTGVFQALKDQNLFEQVHIDSGVVAWPGDLDLAPDAMYSEIKQHGEWLLR